MMLASGTKFCAHEVFFTLKVGRAHPARIAQRRCLPPLTPGAASLESSEGARCRECRILRQASALVPGPQKSCKTTKILARNVLMLLNLSRQRKKFCPRLGF